jgi:hypothetical protein
MFYEIMGKDSFIIVPLPHEEKAPRIEPIKLIRF